MGCPLSILKFRKDHAGQRVDLRRGQAEERSKTAARREIWGCPGRAGRVGTKRGGRIQELCKGEAWQRREDRVKEGNPQVPG